MSNTAALPRSESRSGYRWFPWAICGALGVVVVVNFTMAWLATSSSTGLVTVHAYQEGTHYNDVLAQAAEQDALGWKSRVAVDGRTLTVTITGADGQPIDGLAVNSWLTSPVLPQPDGKPFALTAGANHTYTATIDVPQAGQWEVHIHAKQDKESYYTAQRLFIR